MRGRKRGALLLGATMLLVADALTAQSWRGAAGLEIRVSSRKLGPVSDAVVELKYRDGRSEVGPAPVATNAKGRALIVGLANGIWQVEVQHPDFMSFVAVVRLDSREKPQITASFLQATATQSTPIQVKLLKAKGGTPSPPLPVARRPRPPVAEPISRPEPALSPEPAVDETPAPARPAPEAETTKPVSPAPAVSVEERPLPDVSVPPTPAPESAQPRLESPMGSPATAPQAPVTQASPEPRQTSPPVEPEPTPEPPAPQPAPAARPEPLAVEPVPEAQPAEREPAEPTALPELPEPELEPPVPEPEPPAPGPPLAEVPVAVEAQPAPTAESAAPAAPPPPPPLPPLAAPEWRSYRHRTCPECRPGEWAVSVAVTLAGEGTCSAAVRDDVANALAILGGLGALELAGFAGGLDAAIDVAGGSADRVGPALAGASASGCRVLAIVLPKASRFVGFQFELDGPDGRSACLPDQPCPGGTASFSGPPKIARGAAATVVHALAHGSRGQAMMTVFFRAPNNTWSPDP